MDGLVGVVSLVVFVGVWWWLVKQFRKSGRGFVTRHLLGCIAGWMAGLLVAGAAVSLGLVDAKSVDGVQTKNAGRPPVKYEIVKDEFSEGRPRKVQVQLSRRLTDSELDDLAKKIRDDSDTKADRTYIGFRVEGQTFSTFWANVSFEKKYTRSVNGLTVTDYEALAGLDLSSYHAPLGAWLRDGPLGHVMVLYTINDEYFIDSLFAGGGKNTNFYLGKRLPDGALRLESSDNDFGEYYIVNADGTLQGWGENGLYMTLPLKTPVSNERISHKNG